MKIALCQCDEWEGAYLDGKLILENHSLSASTLLRRLSQYPDLNIELKEIIVDEEWLAEECALPDNLSDVKEAQ